jgi:hypothetical protein
VCKYIIVKPSSEGSATAILGGGADLAGVFDLAEQMITPDSGPLEIFERISVGKPITAVAWEGRRRPGAGA